MTERLEITLHNRQQAHAALKERVYPYLAANLQAERRLSMVIKPATRSTEQNARLHASIADIARQKEWAGKRWDTESWKRLLTAAWCRANAQGVEMVPAIDGAGFDVLYRRTSKLTRAECSDLLEFIYAWGSGSRSGFQRSAAAQFGGGIRLTAILHLFAMWAAIGAIGSLLAFVALGVLAWWDWRGNAN